MSIVSRRFGRSWMFSLVVAAGLGAAGSASGDWLAMTAVNGSVTQFAVGRHDPNHNAAWWFGHNMDPTSGYPPGVVRSTNQGSTWDIVSAARCRCQTSE